jgi:hypothetical protein
MFFKQSGYKPRTGSASSASSDNSAAAGSPPKNETNGASAKSGSVGRRVSQTPTQGSSDCAPFRPMFATSMFPVILVEAVVEKETQKANRCFPINVVQRRQCEIRRSQFHETKQSRPPRTPDQLGRPGAWEDGHFGWHVEYIHEGDELRVDRVGTMLICQSRV